jgi:hypothetical protein
MDGQRDRLRYELIDIQMDGRIEGQMDRHTDVLKEELMDGRRDRQRDEQTGGRMDGRIDGQMDR